MISTILRSNQFFKFFFWYFVLKYLRILTWQDKRNIFICRLFICCHHINHFINIKRFKWFIIKFSIKSSLKNLYSLSTRFSFVAKASANLIPSITHSPWVYFYTLSNFQRHAHTYDHNLKFFSNRLLFHLFGQLQFLIGDKAW